MFETLRFEEIQVGVAAWVHDGCSDCYQQEIEDSEGIVCAMQAVCFHQELPAVGGQRWRWKVEDLELTIYSFL